jgi:hypothetical protein
MAVQEVNGIWISGSFGMRPPQIGGDAVGDRLDVASHMHGLGTFVEEYANTVMIEVDGIPLHVLKSASSRANALLDAPKIWPPSRHSKQPLPFKTVPASQTAESKTGA